MEKLVNVFKNGINYTNYGKANFAIKLLHYGNVCEDLVKRLLDELLDLDFLYTQK